MSEFEPHIVIKLHRARQILNNKIYLKLFLRELKDFVKEYEGI